MARRPRKISEEPAPVQVEVVEDVAQSYEEAALKIIEEEPQEESSLLPEERSELEALEQQVQDSFFTAAAAF